MDIAMHLIDPGPRARLEAAPREPQPPGPGEIRLRHSAIGVNFIDVYFLTGLYPLPGGVPGVEGVGVVEAVGDGVALRPGRRVAYAGAPGAYANTRLLPAWRAVPLPEALGPAAVAASLLRGLTAHMLLTRTFPVAAGTTLLVHAAAGGLGSLICRWASERGARVIGTVGSEAKAIQARTRGAEAVIVGRDADFEAEVARLTGGAGVDFAVDGIGGETLARTLGCVRRFGTVASIGQSAGPIPPLPLEALGPVRSLTLARPSVMAYAAEPEIYARAMPEVLARLTDGGTAAGGPRSPLAEAGRALADLASGRTQGGPLLLP